MIQKRLNPERRKRRPPSIKQGRGTARLLFLIFLMLVHHPLDALARDSAGGQAPFTAKRVLVLCSYGYALPANRKISSAFLTVLENAGISANNLYLEYLDLWRVRDQTLTRVLTDMLAQKYEQVDIDLIVTFHAPAMSLLLSEAKNLFPDTPLISWYLREPFEPGAAGRPLIRLSAGIDVQGTLDRALELFPETKQVVFISGASLIDQYVETEAKRVFGTGKENLRFEYTSNKSMREILERIKSLPPQSVVIYGSVFEDSSGRTFTPRDVARTIAGAANAPMFVLYDTLLDIGVVGGSLLSFEAEGVRTGRLALDVLKGKIDFPESAPAMAGKPIPMFDWSQIKKWDGDASRLPADSIFINRTPSYLAQHKWHIIIGGFFFLAQFFLIASLLVQTRRKGRAEEDLREINETLEQRVIARTAELQESETRYRSLFNSMTEGFAVHEIITGADGKPSDYRFLAVNPAFERLTGLSRDAVIGKTALDVIPNLEPQWIETYGRVALEGLPAHIEDYSAALKRWYEVFAYRTAPGQFAVFFTDITDRKRAEEELRRTSQFPKENPHPVMRLTPEGAILYANTPAREWLATLNWRADGPLPEVVLQAVADVCEQERQVETEITNPAGRTLLFFAVRPTGEEYINLYGIDLTDRKQAERDLAASEQKYRELLETANSVIVRCDNQGIIRFINEYGLRFFGYEAGELVGRHVMTIVPKVEKSTGRDLDALVKDIVIHPEQYAYVPNENITKDGRSVWVAWTNKAILDEQGNILEVLTIGNDITELKETEKALRESDERIRASLAEKEVLLKEIHHRVKNNMQIISSLVALQANESQDAVMREALQDVTNRVRSMAMVHEKLYQSPDLARVDFADYAKSLLNYLWRAHGSAASNIQLKLDLEPVSLPVNLAAPCGLILNELSSNALKHAFHDRDEGALVTVSLRGNAKGQVSLSVRDNGVGLPENLDWRRPRTLGLRLALMLAAQLKATVDVSSLKGTKYMITFERPKL